MRADLEKLVLENMELAKIIAAQICGTAHRSETGKHIQFDDVESIAYSGLVDAALRWTDYCQSRGYDETASEFFKFYARQRITGAVYDEFRNRDWASRTLRSTLIKIRNADPHGELSPTQIAGKTGLPELEVKAALAKRGNSPVSLDALVEEYLEVDTTSVFKASFNDFMSDSVEGLSSVEQRAEGTALLGILVEEFQKLPDEQQVIIALRYFYGVELKEVAKLAGVTEARASSLHTKAVLAIYDALYEAAS